MTTLFAVLLGLQQATVDYEKIASGAIIPHGWKFWLTRASIYSGVASVICLIFKEPILPSLATGAAYFALVHRYTLNSLRGKAYDYLSLSNGYDRFFLGLTKYGGRLAYAVEVSVIVMAKHWL